MPIVHRISLPMLFLINGKKVYSQDIETNDRMKPAIRSESIICPLTGCPAFILLVEVPFLLPRAERGTLSYFL